MKKLVALLAAVILGTQSLYATDFLFMKNVKFYGEGQTVGYAVQNGYDVNLGKLVPSMVGGGISEGMLNSNYSGVTTFLTAGLTFDIVENISADFSLAYSTSMGEGNKFLGLIDNPNGSATKGDSIQSYLDNIRVQTANVTIKKLFDVDGLSIKVGRQYYGDEDSSVMYFGIRHEQPLFGLNLPLIGFDNVSSVDAATVYYEKDNIKANFIYANLGKVLGVPLNVDGLILPLAAEPLSEAGLDLGRDTTVIGADAKFLNLADIVNVQVYAYDIENPIVAHYSIAGVKPGVEIDGLKASVEFAMNFAGKNPFSTGDIYAPEGSGITSGANLIKADVSYDIEKKAKVRAGFAVQGGTEGIKEFLDGEEPGKILIKPFLNFGNYVPGIVFGQQEITRLLSMIDFRAINVGADYYKDKFTFSADYYNFAARDNGLNYGDELDLKVKYKYIEGLDFFCAVGCFMVSDDINSKIKQATGGAMENFLSDITSTIQLGASYKF